jgi:signal transduction histidine kinase
MNSHQDTEHKQAKARLASFYELARRMRTGHHLHELEVFVLDRAIALSGAQRGLLVLNGSQEAPRPAVAVVRGGNTRSQAPQQVMQHIASAILEEALRQGEPRLIADLGRDAHTAPPEQYSIPAGSVLVVPVRDEERIWGAVYLDHPRPDLFHQDDIDFLTAFACPVLLRACHARRQSLRRNDALSHAQEQSAHLAYLNEIGSALTSSLNLTRVLQIIIEGVNALLGTERTSVFLIDEETDELVLRYSNEGDAEIRLPAPWQGIAGWVATHDMPTLVNDAPNDPRHLRQFALDTGYEAHSILCVPLRVEGRVIGVVQVLNKTNDEPFTVHHQQLLMDLTQWAAIALQNARLFDERVRAYQRLEAEQERRIAAETRGAMATVVLDMAHTMNNIIGAIRAWALTLEQTPTSPPDLSRQLLGAIRQNAEEAIDLIRTLRGPLEQPAIEPTSVSDCLSQALQSCWCPDAIHISIMHSPDVPLVSANASRLEAVFHNLLANAIQALADEPGTIEIHTSRTEAGWAAISIRDTGPGIAPELQERLFTPGVSNKHGRLGIGLWLVDTFIQQFGGHICWTSTAGEGTTFSITLPPAAKQAAEEEE